MRRLVTVDLFAGAGGLSLGLRRAGFDVGLAVEEDKWAAETFAANFPDAQILTADLRKFSKSRIAEFRHLAPDLIAGGPPCQSFSHSNVLNHRSADPRNELFRPFLRWVEVLEPSYFLIENVVGLLKAQTSNGKFVIDALQAVARSIGYECEWKVLQAADFGVPQRRTRLFIVGSKTQELKEAFVWPTPLNVPVSLWDAISDLPENEGPYLSKPQSSYQRLMRRYAKKTHPTAHEPMRHTARIVNRFKEIGYGESEASVTAKPVRRGGGGDGRAYEQNSRRQRPELPCSTIVASSHTNFIHPFFHRNFTVRELMRIQSFPDTFVVKGKRAVLSRKLSIRKGLLDEIFLDQRMQIGNAVPPLLAEAIGSQIKNALRQQFEIRNAA